MHEADLHHAQSRLQKKLEAIYRLRRTTTKVNWDQRGYLDLLQKLGNPHLHLPPVIHVAGTNGKGSVIAFLRSVFEAQGLSVHVYTSPHLVQVNERIVLAGKQISDSYLEGLIDEVMLLNDGVPLSFFEIMTAVAFKAFSSVSADIVLLEVGMGGRLDCTNVIDSPLATVINRISLDHTEFLGDTIEKVAFEKAGIMKEGAPCIVGFQGSKNDEVRSVLNDVAREKPADIYHYGDHYRFEESDQSFLVRVGGAEYECLRPSMTGEHQLYNAALVVAVIDQIKDRIEISCDSVAQGIAHAKWPGRMQNIDVGALELPSECEVWLDSGHNDSAGEAIAKQAAFWKGQGDKALHVVVGMMGTKDAGAFLKPVLRYVDGFHVVPLSFDREGSLQSDDFTSCLGKGDSDVHAVSHDDVFSALHAIVRSDPNARILIAGSVYLAGEVLQKINA